MIAVFQDDGAATPITFTASASAASSAFTATTDKTVGKYAIYPYDPSDAASFTWEEDAGDDNMIIKLPGSYTYSDNTLNIPMLGTISGSSISFRSIGGVIRFTIDNIPASAESFWFTATNKNIAGDFLFVASAATPYVEMTSGTTTNSIFVAFTPGSASSLTFSIPVPVGTIDGFTMELLNGELDPVASVTSTANINVARNQVITAPTWFIPNVDVVNRTLTGIGAGSGYDSWSGKSGSSSSAKYAGLSAGGQSAGNPSLQLKAKDNAGIVTTSTGGLVKKIEVYWNSALTINRTLNVYGRQTPYTSSADLYDEDTRGTTLGTISFDASDPPVSTSLSISGSYPYFGLCSSDGAVYIDQILVSWITDSRPTLTAPSFSESEGEIPAGTTVTLSSSDDGTIHYSTDGSTPSESSATYSTGIVVNDNITIKAIAVKDGYKISPVASISYTVPVCAAPSFDTAEGPITSGSDVTIENNEAGSVIYYTTDGSEPDGSSYSGVAGEDVVISNITTATTIKAFSRRAGKKDSSISEVAYTISGIATPLTAPLTITFDPYADSFIATWENNANAMGYEWVISESATEGDINLATEPHGSFTVASPALGGASLSEGTWTLTTTVDLEIRKTYYLYILVKGDGSSYSDSGYSVPVNKTVPLVVTAANITLSSYSNEETEFTNNALKFGYTRCMYTAVNQPTTNMKAGQMIQMPKKVTGNKPTDPGVLYNKDALGTSIKNIRVYLVKNDNTFSISYGTSTAVSSGTKQKSDATSSTSFSHDFEHKTSGVVSENGKYYDFDLSSLNVNYFKLTNGSGGANYIWKIEIIY